MTLLDPGSRFPDLLLNLPGAGRLELPDAVAGHYAVVLFFRGSWCPYCNAQLRAFERAKDAFAKLDANIVALSVDDEAATADLIAKHALSFSVAYGANAEEVAEATGAFVNDEPRYLQSTGFLLDPTGRVIVSVYSSGAIGRLVPEDVLGLLRYMSQHRPPD